MSSWSCGQLWSQYSCSNTDTPRTIENDNRDSHIMQVRGSLREKIVLISSGHMPGCDIFRPHHCDPTRAHIVEHNTKDKQTRGEGRSRAPIKQHFKHTPTMVHLWGTFEKHLVRNRTVSIFTCYSTKSAHIFRILLYPTERRCTHRRGDFTVLFVHSTTHKTETATMVRKKDFAHTSSRAKQTLQ